MRALKGGLVNIIRDEQNPIMMLPLLCQWNIRRCNYRNCKETPNTIIAGAGKNIPVFGLCEKHYQIGNRPGGCKLNLIFDNSDGIIDTLN